MFSRARHGSWCNSRTFPTRCRYCNEKVFYFSCDHGSKVFFDDLGPPWPLHRCVEFDVYRFVGATPVEIIQQKVEPVTPKEISVEEIARAMMSRSIEREYTSRLQEAVKQNNKPLHKPNSPDILRQEPYTGLVTDEDGIVRELSEDVNFFRKFKVPETSVGKAILGSLAAERFVQMTIHTGALGEEEDKSSFTFFISRRILSG